MTVSLHALWLFGLVLMRLSGLFVVAPLLSSFVISRKVKVSTLIILSIFLTTVLPVPSVLPANLVSGAFALAAEFLLGLLLGVGFRTAMEATAMAGELIGLQTGLGAASLFDPSSGQSAALMENFYGILFLLLFVTLDGHHHMLRILADSFTLIPAATAVSSVTSPVTLLITQSAETLAYGVRLATPVIVPLLLLTLAAGLVSRICPQANILSLSYGMSTLFGLLLMGFSISSIGEAMRESIYRADRYAWQLLNALGAM